MLVPLYLYFLHVSFFYFFALNTLVPSLTPLSTCWFFYIPLLSTRQFLLFLHFLHTGSFSHSTLNTLVPSLPSLSTCWFLYKPLLSTRQFLLFLRFQHTCSLSLFFLHTDSSYPFTFHVLFPFSPSAFFIWFLFSPSAFHTLVPSLPALSTCWFLLSLHFLHTGSSIHPLSTRQFHIFLCFQHICSFSPCTFNTLIPSLSLHCLHTGFFSLSNFYKPVPPLPPLSTHQLLPSHHPLPSSTHWFLLSLRFLHPVSSIPLLLSSAFNSTFLFLPSFSPSPPSLPLPVPTHWFLLSASSTLVPSLPLLLHTGDL
jgi:hypothetical protein